ncbi:hypothetical protein KY284_005304 [Solanum tuberosum]|nr:hypothetical protein KY284_005304 [Solanum tuberosum]
MDNMLSQQKEIQGSTKDESKRAKSEVVECIQQRDMEKGIRGGVSKNKNEEQVQHLQEYTERRFHLNQIMAATREAE